MHEPEKESHQQIPRRFKNNIGRCKRLVTIANDMKDGRSKDDILRAAVVLLHAAMEDVIRSVLNWKLPHVLPKNLGHITCTLADVADLKKPFQKARLAELVEKKVRDHYDHDQFSTVKEVQKAIGRVVPNLKAFQQQLSRLDKMIKRRHDIVHRADRMSISADSHGKITPIDADSVARWIENVEEFGIELYGAVDMSKPPKYYPPQAPLERVRITKK